MHIRRPYYCHSGEAVSAAAQGALGGVAPLCLNLGVDSLTCIDHEEEKLASIMTHPTLHQGLQNSQWNRRGQGSCSLLERVMAAIPTVWADGGDVPDTVSKWQS